MSSSSCQSSLIPKPKFILQNSKPITCLLFSTKINDSSILYAANRDGELSVYDLNLKRSLFSHNPNKQSISSIIELDEKNLLTYERNGSIHKWTSENNSDWISECVYEKEVYTFCSFQMSEERNLLFVPSNKASYIDCIEMSSFKNINTLRLDSNKSDRGMLMNMKVVDLNLLLACYENGELILFDLRTLNEIASYDFFEGQPLMCFDYSKKNNFGCVGSPETTMHQFEIDSQTNLINKINSISLSNSGLNCIKIRPSDSKIFACGGWDSRIRIFGTKKQNLLAVLDFHKGTINSIDFSLKNIMCAGSNDGIISFYDLYN